MKISVPIVSLLMANLVGVCLFGFFFWCFCVVLNVGFCLFVFGISRDMVRVRMLNTCELLLR